MTNHLDKTQHVSRSLDMISIFLKGSIEWKSMHWLFLKQSAKWHCPVTFQDAHQQMHRQSSNCDLWDSRVAWLKQFFQMSLVHLSGQGPLAVAGMVLAFREVSEWTQVHQQGPFQVLGCWICLGFVWLFVQLGLIEIFKSVYYMTVSVI